MAPSEEKQKQAISVAVPSDASPSRTLASALSPTSKSPSSATSEADKERAMRHANEWKPALDRRMSWNREDQKREVLMKDCYTVQGPGFTEKA